MRAKKKLSILAFAGMMMMNIASSQKAVPLEIISSMRQANDTNLLQYAMHKQLPPGFEKETLQALSHFPELKNVTVKFRIKKSLSTLKTRPTFVSVFLPKGHRSYVITISNKTSAKLTPLMFVNLPTEARIGIVGHELSHVADLSAKSTWHCFIVGVRHLSARYLDHFEYNTDLICIKHGLGKNLEAWSSYIRNTMHTVYWRGAGYANKGDMGYERYMNPATIEKNINAGDSARLIN
jgi:hypothetical protein